MKLVRFAVLYTALALGANATLADMAAVEALREGDMKKLNFHSEAKPVADVGLVDIEDQPVSLSEHGGKIVLLNFWATWCAPCRKEMPALNRLQQQLGGDDFAVVTVATGHNPVPGINRFFDQNELTDLPKWRDPKQQFAREMGVLGLPVTMVLDRDGQEIARLIGDAVWDSESAIAILEALIAGD
ncbi:TlpA disulfide reductase family protein [Actibacterium pelagium]|uniref:Thioredoxin n=1 Tax=Actibacterium pelagium TaxID=2029103 RepID=A0A917EL18_9RHOB|nr:TlpA disulfide reductase family protein [Actibacterium pelagium]GGE51460.1 thioredoxin [Actibacterium pelagium]